MLAILFLVLFAVAGSRSLGLPPYLLLVASAEGDNSRGLDARSTDARSVVGAFTRRSYRAGDLAVLNLWENDPAVPIEIMLIWFTHDLRSAFAIKAPETELCAARVLPDDGC